MHCIMHPIHCLRNKREISLTFLHTAQVITNVSHALPSWHFFVVLLTHSTLSFLSIAILTTWQHYCELTQISTWRLHHVHLLLLSDDILTITIMNSCLFLWLFTTDMLHINLYMYTLIQMQWKANFSIKLFLTHTAHMMLPFVITFIILNTLGKKYKHMHVNSDKSFLDFSKV